MRRVRLSVWNALRRAAMSVAAVLAVAITGCCPPCPPVPTTDCSDCPVISASTDPTVVLVTIAANFCTSPPDDEVKVNKPNGGIQWYNDSESTVTIAIIGGPLSMVVPPKSYSPVHRLTENATQGQTFSYTVDPPCEDAPDPPSFGVGP